MKFSVKWFVARLGMTLLISLFTGYKLAEYNHKGYWQRTIRRVQTVDFNILSHTLPTKLSHLLIEENIEELQKTINSNYGYFGLVVTNCKTKISDCQEQKIIHSTQTDAAWKQQLNENILLNSSFSILKNPPPLLTETQFPNSRSEIPQSTGKINQGEIIGRVYYIRGIPPKFNDDVRSWVKKSLEEKKLSDSNAGGYYKLVLFLSFIGWMTGILIVEFFQYSRRDRQRTIQLLTDKNEQLLRDLKNFNQQIEKVELRYKEKIKILFKQISEAQNEISELSQNERNRIQNESRIIQLEKNIKALETQKHELQQKYENKIYILKQKINNNSQVLSNLNNDFINLQAQKETTNNNIQNSEEFIQYNLIYKAYLQDLKDLVEILEEENENINIDIKHIKENNKKCTYEYNSLRSAHAECMQALSRCGKLNSIKGEEKEFYHSEKIDVILEVLKQSLNNIEDNTRKKYLIDDIVKHNNISQTREKLKEKIRSICKDYRSPNARIINDLAEIGLEIVSDNKHVKFIYKNDNRYTFSFPKTSSDSKRGGENMSHLIIRKIL